LTGPVCITGICKGSFSIHNNIFFKLPAFVTVGKNLKKGAIVVMESTVYPGVTEDIMVPILERESGMKCGKDILAGISTNIFGSSF
jgi:UDP-N-acetyl-D-mannosaminuronate dehydrogenase